MCEEVMDIKSLTEEELKNLITDEGFPGFRAKQIYDWLHVKLVRDYDAMLNLPSSMRESFREKYPITVVKQVRVQESKLDGTRKYLFELSDGNYVESVFMRYKHGNSVCISSQVGCKMGCRFCASTLDGWERNLLPSEMLDQIYAITLDTKERVSNVVVMGTGEPMDNYDNFVRFYKLLTSENGLNISGRNVTVSTCGLVPMMRKLADEKLSLTLALSLHAVSDEKRRTLMPIANTYSIDELMDACQYYFEKTGRRITFEYSLVAGVNDSIEDAKQLSALAGRVGAHVNLIPVNPIKERDYERGSAKAIAAFKNKLEKNAINVTIRREMGQDIDGACGQLRRRQMLEKSNDIERK
ncbi:MAG: 23S rRNA (adenine(2503)-C(2))-methyltransferase RlmN [Lachnospiraceae bacterium]|nr:23S rRNA (adenine(2503)-C(2))-methyltransferase RlmN [Candidatus Colinaster equi]